MTIIFVLCTIFLLLAIKKPAWALGSVLFLLPTYQIRFNLLGFPTTLLEVLILLFLLGFIASWPDFKSLAKLKRINWAIVLFLTGAVIATIISPEKMRALGQLKAFFIEPVLLFYAANILFKDKANLKLALQALFLSAMLISVFGLVQHVTFLGLPIRFWGSGIEPTRITSVFDYPNALALFLAPLLGLFTILIYKKEKLFTAEWLEMLGLILMALALLLTFSRGAWLAVIMALGLFLIRHHHPRIIMAALIVIAAAGFAITPIRQRIISSFSDDSSGQHWQLMKVGAQKILQEPFLGNGLYGFRTTLAQRNFQGEILNYPHNIFLNFWLETGLLGLLGFALIIFVISQQYKKHPTVWGLGASTFLLILILHGLVDAPYFKNDLAVLFWVSLSLFYV